MLNCGASFFLCLFSFDVRSVGERRDKRPLPPLIKNLELSATRLHITIS